MAAIPAPEVAADGKNVICGAVMSEVNFRKTIRCLISCRWRAMVLRWRERILPMAIRKLDSSIWIFLEPPCPSWSVFRGKVLA